jgi:DNA polymerase-4
VAATKFVAKLASEAAKPRASPAGIVPGAGVFVVAPGEELAFLHPLPVEALWGVGPVTATRLREFGVTTIGELAAIPLDTLERAVGSAHGRHLHELAWARDPRRVEPNRAVKSVGHEETYRSDLVDLVKVQREVVRMAESVATRLRAGGVTGRTVTLKVRYGDFTTITRSKTLRVAIDTGPAIAQAAGELLGGVDIAGGVRLLGVSVANLAEGAPHQMALSFDGAAAAEGDSPGERSSESTDQSWHDAARAVDLVRARFGAKAVGPAVLLEPDGLRLKRQGDSQWGPGSADPQKGETGL